MVKVKKPDYLIMDLSLAQMEGGMVLERIHADSTIRKKPEVIICTGLLNKDSYALVNRFGCRAYLVKPIKAEYVLHKLDSLMDEKGRYPLDEDAAYHRAPQVSTVKEETATYAIFDVEEAATNLLKDMGMPTRYKGFRYLRDAMLMGFEDFEKFHNIGDGIYKPLARSYHSTGARVERCMRNAIENTYKAGNLDFLNSIISSVSPFTGKPCNREFLTGSVTWLQKEAKKSLSNR
jgi:two-component system response regulator (stage 0 sporulation protein A)